MMRRMHKTEWVTEPYKCYSKTPRADYVGYCVDCADD